MSSSRVDSLEVAKKLVRGDKVDYRKLLEQGDPLIALAMCRVLGVKMEIAKMEYLWTNHLNESVPCTLLQQAMEVALSEMSYEEVIEYFLKNNYNKTTAEFAGDLLLKRMHNDVNFAKKLNADNVLLPILFSINATLAEKMPEFVRPLSTASKQYLAADRLQHLEFDANELTNHQQDILAIHELLSDKEKMLSQLDHLESELNAKIKAWSPEVTLPLKPLRGYDHKIFKKPYAKKSGQSFLFGFFKDWATTNDFADVVRLLDVKSDADFIENLKKSWLFKDPAFGGEFHGAWTHLIQWYCIVNAYKTGELKLNDRPAQVFQAIGENADQENLIWDKTFENNKTAIANLHDFRSVTHFNKFINHDESFAIRCPTLQAMIYYRALRDEVKRHSPK